jgi:hypothetical protein
MKPITLPTSKMAAYLGISKDFLLKNKNKLFKKGLHFYEPTGINKTLWNIRQMEKWVIGKEENPFKDILNEL